MVAIGTLAPGLVDGLQAEHGRGEVLDAFTTMMERLAQDRMLWLVFEDLRWVDGLEPRRDRLLIRAVGP